MNLEKILTAYRNDPRTARLEQAIHEPGKHFLLSGLVGAQPAFVLSALFQREACTHLFLANDKEEAAYLQNNLEVLLASEKALFFPDSFRKPQFFEDLNRTNVLQRTEVVSEIVGNRNKSNIIVSYPEALFEQVVAPKILEQSAIEMKVGEDLDVDFLVEVLVEYGFEHVDFVYEPGQFSIRGGIVDIYSYGNEWPYRIDLFDEEVESIRTFDPNTQRSEARIAKVTIIPNINTKFDQTEKTSLLRILPEKTCIWAYDVQLLLDRLQECFEKAQEYGERIEQLREDELLEEAELLEERAFILPNVVMDDLKRFSSIEIGNKAFFKPLTLELSYDAVPQPSFNRNFELLIENLKQNTKDGVENFIFAASSKQVQRFYSIFEDLNAHVKWHPISVSIHRGFVDRDLKLACYTDHQVFERYHKYRVRKGFDKNTALKLKQLKELKPGDFVTHIDHGVGRYSGLEKIQVQDKVQEVVRLIYRDNDVLYVGINSLHKISKYIGKDGRAPKLHKLGSDTWNTTKRKTKKKVKEMAIDLIDLYAKRRATKGFRFAPDGYLQNELEASFIYEDTPDQAKATEVVKEDMEKEYPMDRLICGDVGFGKTEVAVRAAFKAVVNGKQVAVLVPTTILALQHAQTFKNRLEEFGVKVDYINRFRSAKEKTAIYKALEAGEIDVLIGTHAILNKRVKFKDMGLLVIDEEQKFGVAAKEKLRNMKVNVDTLAMTATPIPRTLQFSLMAARDLSVISTPPPNRQPIDTEVLTFDDELIQEAIEYEVHRGGQVFFLHNRVKNLPEVTAMINRLCPNFEIAMAHGQMDPKKLEKTLFDFMRGRFDVLVCTNIIETGLDIPNANTIIINNAHHFGLSDLHQLRGRVGRSNKKAFCYLFCPPMSTLTSEARRRLQTIEQFSELGSGLNIAMKDLDIRGAGNLLGGEQSGFIMDIGYETYQKILEEAIQELKERDYKELFKEELEQKRNFVRDVQIDTDQEMHLPDSYVNSIQERLNLYTELDKVEDEEQLEKFAEALRDRFGKLPEEVYNLFEALRLRWFCKRIGFERLILKNNKMRCYFISDQESPFFESPHFHSLLQYLQQNSDHRFYLKQSAKYLILVVEKVSSLKKARTVLKRIEEGVLEGVER